MIGGKLVLWRKKPMISVSCASFLAMLGLSADNVKGWAYASTFWKEIFVYAGASNSGICWLSRHQLHNKVCAPLDKQSSMLDQSCAGTWLAHSSILLHEHVVLLKSCCRISLQRISLTLLSRISGPLHKLSQSLIQSIPPPQTNTQTKSNQKKKKNLKW